MQKKDTYNVAVLGATGAVGRAMLETLERRDFPVGELRLLASPRSAGQVLSFRGRSYPVQAAEESAFEGIDIALFSAGASASQVFAPMAVRQGAVVVDNSSAFRMQEDVPLVVPEVNPHAVAWHKGIIANPNCSTIQLVVALKPLAELGLDHVTVSTYQAVSGMGQKAIDALMAETEGRDPQHTTLFPVASQPQHHRMAFNVLPQCDVFLDNDYTKEEMKLVNESRKILELPELRVSPTAVRVPVVYGHSEAVRVRFTRPVSAAEVRARLEGAPGVVVVDDPAQALYPHPLMAAGTGETYVGRIRQDLADDHAVLMFVVADNLLKGAAWNAVQIAELLIRGA
ncbi:aspartate-semialdehyde dehydrogenase [Alicyclobacillus macrosporangiidus]|uniref:Aspartate-semialdehyde dehydrogenase n=1 Tax=Alicyclobacillus macrosporangiidus TaxID=392015 RepID=A0A1I7ISJ0_9BACL|nr:aspartate-semialdehyde dehydrogenase [Alicyclobacillus macrosporangiidus]SFU75886.1 aspartate-semialdehyde dehydrogenase [Alicyclobacillus macrosporangiidus]